MEEIAVKPKKAQLMTNVIGLGILCGLSLAEPMLGPVCAVLTPLFACPMVKHKEEWLCWAVAAMPAAGWILSGWDVWIALALLLPGMLPLCVTRALHPKDRTGPNGILLYCCLAALSLAALLGVASWRMGATMAELLPQLVMDAVRKTPDPNQLLFRLASAGLVSLPKGFQRTDLLSRLLEPGLTNQMLLSLGRTVELFAQSVLPMLLVQISILTGLFTTLRLERLNGVMIVVEIDPRKPGERKTRVTSPPGFRMLDLPLRVRAGLFAAMVLAALFAHTGSLGQTFALMCYQLGSTAFQLTGSAVMVYVFARRSPDSIRLIGAVTGAIYVMAPTVPLIIGILDTFVHYRANKVRDPDSDS